jgi:hypothetical protein
MVRTTIYLTEDLHSKVKIFCAMKQNNVSNYLRYLIESDLLVEGIDNGDTEKNIQKSR